jgi:hypothetical protein
MLRTMDELESEGSTQDFRPVILQSERDLPVPHLLPSGTMVSAGLARGGLPPRVLRRIREYIDGNIESSVNKPLSV